MSVPMSPARVSGVDAHRGEGDLALPRQLLFVPFGKKREDVWEGSSQLTRRDSSCTGADETKGVAFNRFHSGRSDIPPACVFRENPAAEPREDAVVRYRMPFVRGI